MSDCIGYLSLYTHIDAVVCSACKIGNFRLFYVVLLVLPVTDYIYSPNTVDDSLRRKMYTILARR